MGLEEDTNIGQIKIKLDDIIKELRFSNYLTVLLLYEKMDLRDKKVISGPEAFVKQLKIDYEEWIKKAKDCQ